MPCVNRSTNPSWTTRGKTRGCAGVHELGVLEGAYASWQAPFVTLEIREVKLATHRVALPGPSTGSGCTA